MDRGLRSPRSRDPEVSGSGSGGLTLLVPIQGASEPLKWVYQRVSAMGSRDPTGAYGPNGPSEGPLIQDQMLVMCYSAPLCSGMLQMVQIGHFGPLEMSPDP